MEDIKNLTNGLSAIVKKNMEIQQQQQQNWYGMFNHTGSMSSSFIYSFLNYARMSFVSSAIAHDKKVTEKSVLIFDLDKYPISKIVSNLCDIGGKVIFSSDFDILISWNDSIAHLNISNRYCLNIISFNELFAETCFKEYK